ncbi:MAG: prepilin-type N-terminal cleavage/methylation domain-containing protein [Micrococcales bacterium]|nr:prepilin-type N-terminal cleavage/methylation domain-containing protein [Micrococcales bacterium]
MTLIEMLVAIALFSIFIGISFASVTQLTRTATTATSRANSANAVVNVFSLLDRQVRYADSINFAGMGASGNSYIEFRTPASATNSGVVTCTQWRFDPTRDVIEYRSWPSAPSPQLPAFATKATDVQGTASSTYPFKLIQATAAGSLLQQLQLRITGGSPVASDQTDISTQYVARNSSNDPARSPSNADANGDSVSDNPVCNPTGYRP